MFRTFPFRFQLCFSPTSDTLPNIKKKKSQEKKKNVAARLKKDEPQTGRLNKASQFTHLAPPPPFILPFPFSAKQIIKT